MPLWDLFSVFINKRAFVIDEAWHRESNISYLSFLLLNLVHCSWAVTQNTKIPSCSYNSLFETSRNAAIFIISLVQFFTSGLSCLLSLSVLHLLQSLQVPVSFFPHLISIIPFAAILHVYHIFVSPISFNLWYSPSIFPCLASDPSVLTLISVF